jgi:hypothetical protein
MSQVNHTERAHALLSASGSSRWLNCTPSARLEEQFPDSSSDFAAEGTLAHELAEAKLRARHNGDEETLTHVRARVHAHVLYSEDMEQYTDQYVDYVTEVFAEARARDKAAIIETEVRVSLEAYVPEGFGTIDNVIIGGATLDVIDLKYGKGVRVSAEENSQLKLYALGALQEYSFLYHIDTVRMHIHQPRLDAVSVYEISAAKLLIWGEEVVIPRAKEAHTGEGEQVPGSWCHFCKAKHRCAALGREALELAQQDYYKEPLIMTDEQVLEVYEKADRMVSWLNGLEARMLQEAIEGKKWQGLKLVEGRSKRRISDEDQAIQALRADGFTDEDFMTMELQGITALEKLLGKKGFESVLGPLVVKPAGKPTLVSASDKRPELQPGDAASDYDEPVGSDD